jgi:hypothetical protein
LGREHDLGDVVVMLGRRRGKASHPEGHVQVGTWLGHDEAIEGARNLQCAFGHTGLLDAHDPHRIAFSSSMPGLPHARGFSLRMFERAKTR